jgi:riboflavin synthase
VFTGLVQALGTIHHRSDYELAVSWDTAQGLLISSDLALGDSVAVDGICLTVMELLPHGFIAAVSPETVNRTTLNQGSLHAPVVNLESSLRVGGKVGGHFVTGHIDGIGRLESSVQTETSWEMSFIVSDPRIARYIVPKGSIAINGVSLTVADCNDSGTWFSVAVIPVTYRETNLQFLMPGSLVNLEGDVLGKYVEKFMRLQHSPNASIPQSSDRHEVSQVNEGIQNRMNHHPITEAFLAEHGYG